MASLNRNLSLYPVLIRDLEARVSDDALRPTWMMGRLDGDGGSIDRILRSEVNDAVEFWAWDLFSRTDE